MLISDRQWETIEALSIIEQRAWQACLATSKSAGDKPERTWQLAAQQLCGAIIALVNKGQLQ